LKAAVYQQPTTVVIEADQPVFKFYSQGVISTGCGPYINAMATIVGYGNSQGDDAFYVKNSWGSDWGFDEYAYISTNGTFNNGFGACGILEVPVFPTGS
jgi:C1A family cysteine protease